LVVVPLLQVSGALSHSVFGRVAPVPVGWDVWPLLVVPAAEVAPAPADVGGELLLLEPLHADNDKAAVRPSTAPE
jgi:hypothetical protein